MAITLRNTKGLPLTHEELDGNFTNLDTRVATLENAADSDNQTLSFTGTTLTISSGNSVDLSSLLDDTDAQTLSLVGDTLSISGGNSVDLSKYTDSTFSGDYNDLTNKPTIPANINDLGDVTLTTPADGDFLVYSSGQWINSVLLNNIVSGSNISLLNNDAGYITASYFPSVSTLTFGTSGTSGFTLTTTPNTTASSPNTITIQPGLTTGSATQSGYLNLTAGDSDTAAIPGGNVFITGGSGSNGANGGDVYIRSGAAFGGGTDGTIYIDDNTVVSGSLTLNNSMIQSVTSGVSSSTTTITQDLLYTNFSKVDVIDDGFGGINTDTYNIRLGNNRLQFENTQIGIAGYLQNSTVSGDLYVQAGNGEPVDGQRNGGTLYLRAGARASGATDGGHIIMNSNSGDIFIGPLGNTQNIRIGGGPGYGGSTGTTFFYGATDFSNATVDWANIVGSAIQNNGLPVNTFTTGDFEVRGNISLSGSRTISPVATSDFLGSDITIQGGTSTDLSASGGDVFIEGGLGVGGGDNGVVRIDQNAAGGVWIGKADGTGDDIQTYSRLRIHRGVTEDYVAKADATGVVEHDCDGGHLFYHTSPDANWTVNLTNLNSYNNMATNITIVIVQGGTGYYPNALQIGGAAQTILWQGSAAPTPTTNGVDVVTFSIIYDGLNYTVLGQMTDFGAVA